MIVELPRCSICYSELVEGLVNLECGHVFHQSWQIAYSLLQAASCKINHCPLCRRSYSIQEVRQILLDIQLLSQSSQGDMIQKSQQEVYQKLIRDQQEEINNLTANLQVAETRHKDYLQKEVVKDTQIKQLKKVCYQEKQSKEQFAKKFKDSHQKIQELQYEIDRMSKQLIVLKNEDLETLRSWITHICQNFEPQSSIDHLSNALLLKEQQLRSLQVDYEQIKFQNQAVQQNYRNILQKFKQKQQLPEKLPQKRIRSDPSILIETDPLPTPRLAISEMIKRNREQIKQ